MRGGSTIHTIVINQFGATPVNMPAGRAHEAMSRGTVDGGVLTIPGWRAYAFQDVLKYIVTDVAIGHWQSYLAISDAAWNKLTPKQRIDRSNALFRGNRVGKSAGHAEKPNSLR